MFTEQPVCHFWSYWLRDTSRWYGRGVRHTPAKRATGVRLPLPPPISSTSKRRMRRTRTSVRLYFQIPKKREILTDGSFIPPVKIPYDDVGHHVHRNWMSGLGFWSKKFSAFYQYRGPLTLHQSIECEWIHNGSWFDDRVLPRHKNNLHPKGRIIAVNYSNSCELAHLSPLRTSRDQTLGNSRGKSNFCRRKIAKRTVQGYGFTKRNGFV